LTIGLNAFSGLGSPSTHGFWDKQPFETLLDLLDIAPHLFALGLEYPDDCAVCAYPFLDVTPGAWWESSVSSLFWE